MKTIAVNNNVVVLDNKIIESLCPLSLVEKRVIYLLLGNIGNSYFRSYTEEEISNPSVTPEDVKKGVFVTGESISSELWYRLSVREYTDSTNVRIDNAREELKSIIESLRTKYILFTLKDSESFIKVNWVSSVMFDAKEDCIGIRWNSDVIPYISNLTTYFTKLRLKEVLLLRSTYSWKLHEILTLLRGTQDYRYKEVSIDIEELKRMLGVPTGLQEYRYFKFKILNHAVNELISKGVRLNLRFKEVKRGRKVVRLLFCWE